jgi:hypothetical protein
LEVETRWAAQGQEGFELAGLGDGEVIARGLGLEGLFDAGAHIGTGKIHGSKIADLGKEEKAKG